MSEYERRIDEAQQRLLGLIADMAQVFRPDDLAASPRPDAPQYASKGRSHCGLIMPTRWCWVLSAWPI
jgi:hypothetical protein